MKQDEALTASRKKVVYTVIHELRVPLAAITGHAGLIRKDCNTDKTGTYIWNIQESSDRMREMLDTLLSFFQPNNGKEQPNFSTCRISAITHTLETGPMPITINKGPTLIIHYHKNVFACTDEERILRIGDNLLFNAIKFTRNGNASLRTDHDNGLLKLIVEDTGTSIIEEEQQRVLGAFERLSNAATKDGLGLGLPVVQRIVTMLDGIIRLESNKGRGSRFTTEIPIQIAEEPPEQINKTQVHHNSMFHEVIAIDSDEVLLLMLKEMCAQEGIHYDTRNDAAEFMEMVRKKEYSLLLTDLSMPDINGFGLLELLRASSVGNSRTIPVVVTTTSSSYSKEELVERGFARYLLKPFSVPELIEISDKCTIEGEQNERPDFTSLLSYGNEAVMLEKLTTEVEKEMQSFRYAEQRKDLPELDALIHHLHSSWEILRADRPLRELYKPIHHSGTLDSKAIGNAVRVVLDRDSEIIRLVEGERKKYNNG